MTIWVVALNAFARHFNEENAATIAAGTVAAVAESSVEFIDEASGIKRRYVIDKASVLNPAPDDVPRWFKNVTLTVEELLLEETVAFDTVLVMAALWASRAAS